LLCFQVSGDRVARRGGRPHHDLRESLPPHVEGLLEGLDPEGFGSWAANVARRGEQLHRDYNTTTARGSSRRILDDYLAFEAAVGAWRQS
jgi:hypothetical protein